MKRIGFSLLLLLAFWGCKKDSDHEQYQQMSFEVAGLPLIAQIEQLDTLDIPIFVNYLLGTKEKVTLQVSGIPPAMGASFNPAIDTPGFSSVLRFVANSPDTGLYTITVTAADTRGSKIYSFQLHVVPNPVNPADILAGQYHETGPCSVSGSLNDTVTVISELPVFNKIRLSKLYNNHPSTQVIADLDPVNQTLVIPPQVINSAVYSGSGSYTATQISIIYRVDVGIGPVDSCSVILDRL